MRQVKKKFVLEACKLSFEGNSDAEVAKFLKTSVSNISRWRKTPLWQEFEQELIDAHKQALLGNPSSVPTLESTQ